MLFEGQLVNKMIYKDTFRKEDVNNNKSIYIGATEPNKKKKCCQHNVKLNQNKPTVRHYLNT